MFSQKKMMKFVAVAVLVAGMLALAEVIVAPQVESLYPFRESPHLRIVSTHIT